MASRKTVSVKDMIAYANNQLSRVDDYATKDFKSGICTMIESLLHMTDNYSGFMFNNNSDSDISLLLVVENSIIMNYYVKYVMV